MHPNHVGSPALITDATGTQVITRMMHKPYGEIVRDVQYSSGPDITRKKFTGQEEDAETGLIYFQARYYDPAIGRFITSDSEFGGQGTQGFNRHMYATGNPVKYTDPSGHNAEDQAERYDMSKADEKGNVPERGRSESVWDKEERGGQVEASGAESTRDAVGESVSREHVEKPNRGDRGAAGASNAIDNSQLNSMIQTLVAVNSSSSASSSSTTSQKSENSGMSTVVAGAGWISDYTDWERNTMNSMCGGNCHPYFVQGAWGTFDVLMMVYSAGMYNPSARAAAIAMARTAPTSSKGINIVRNMTLSGGRSGGNVKNLMGPPNSVIAGNGERVYVTNSQGQVILDITRTRVKTVSPGKGFVKGSKDLNPTSDQLKLVDEFFPSR